MDFDRIRLWFEAGERETSSSSCQLNLVFQGEHSFWRSWRLGISCEKKPVKNEPLSVRHGGEVLNGPKRPLILRSSAHPIVGERSGDSNELHGQRRSVVSMSPWLLLYLPPQRSPCVDFSRRRMVVGMRRVVSSDCRWQGISKTRSATVLRLSLHDVSVEALRPGGTVLRRWSFDSVESSLLSD